MQSRVSRPKRIGNFIRSLRNARGSGRISTPSEPELIFRTVMIIMAMQMTWCMSVILIRLLKPIVLFGLAMNFVF